MVVEVLTFSTAVVVAAARGAMVFAYRWDDGAAARYARSVRALLAGPRGEATYSLSPRSLMSLRESPRRRACAPRTSSPPSRCAWAHSRVLVLVSLRRASGHLGRTCARVLLSSAARHPAVSDEGCSRVHGGAVAVPRCLPRFLKLYAADRIGQRGRERIPRMLESCPSRAIPHRCRTEVPEGALQ